MPNTKAALVTCVFVILVTVVCVLVVWLTPISVAEVLGVTAVSASLVSIYLRLAEHFKKE
jgi:Na+/H+ antiporter NhaC